MAERDITRGKWVDIENEDQFNDCVWYGCSNPKFKGCPSDIQRGNYQGPGRYRLLYYEDKNRVVFELKSVKQAVIEINVQKQMLDHILSEQ